MELSQLTMSQYVSVVCGDVSCLGISDPRKAAEARRKLIGDYAMIADKASASAYLTRRKGEGDDKATLLLFRILSNLCVMKEWDAVRSLLSDYGVSAERMTDEQVAAEVERRRKRAKSMVERAEPTDSKEEEEPPRTAEEIRRSFDRQAASLMAYYKFQISLPTIRATEFAYLVDQADREIRARKSALGKA